MQQAGKFEQQWLNAQEQILRKIHHTHRFTAATHLETGLLGEQATFFELRRRGYIVVGRRWTHPRLRGDVDLIAWDGPSLCFIEVKTRTARDLHPAESAVDETKRRMLRGLARIYLRAFPEQQRRTIPVRFDVVSVYSVSGATEFEFFHSAFGWH